MEYQLCNYCGFHGPMPFLHGTYQCPGCHYHLLPQDTDSDQSLFDEDLEETESYPVFFVQDMLLQRG